jgi:uncharacterized membrane protein (DUF2068 family)
MKHLTLPRFWKYYNYLPKEIQEMEAIGLWYERFWAQWLIIGTVGISIPPELFELWK